ncbi:MAG: TlpA family protein disulfide reductase, partial [Chlorobi bacterium]|nr:TlpA family protein disulfide reductase [Chlorobiota bacterium]
FYGDKNQILDTVIPDTLGNFSFLLKDNYPSGMYRVFLEEKVFFDIIYNREDIEIQTQYNHLYDSLEIVSSRENGVYYDFLRKRNDYLRKFDLLATPVEYYPTSDSFYFDLRNQYVKIQEDYAKYIDDVIAENPDYWSTKIIKQRRPIYFDPELNEAERREYNIAHYFDPIDFSDVELVRSNIYTTLAIEYMSLYSNSNFTQEQLENSFIVAVDKIMYEAMDNNIIYDFIVDYLVGGFERFHFDKVLDYIAENYAPEQCENEERKTDLQTRLSKYAELTNGKQAPDINIPDVDGNTIKLSRIKAEYTLVLFWASWCPHCNETLPKIQNIYENSTNRKKLEVLSISLDTEKGEWKSAIDTANYTWLNACDLRGWDSKSATDYNVYATPTMFLLDKNKKIVAKPITFAELKTVLMKENIIE